MIGGRVKTGGEVEPTIKFDIIFFSTKYVT